MQHRAAGPRTAGGFDVLALQLANTQVLPGEFGSRNDLTEAAVGPKFTYAWQGWSLMATYGWRIGSYDRSGAANSSMGSFG
jgi:hypothetical protein